MSRQRKFTLATFRETQAAAVESIGPSNRPVNPATPMPALSRDDYALGTHDAEGARLGLQHRVWRSEMLAGWDRADIMPGARVVDVGAGPGYATLELAERVGPDGHVLALERSGRFTGVLRAEIERRGLRHVEVRTVDLTDPNLLDDEHLHGFDFAWCRWIACFLPDVSAYARLLARMIRPGGRLVTHEYARYESWQFIPPQPHHKRFIAEVLANWHDGGGDPDVAGHLTEALRHEGFKLESARPMVFTAAPGEPFWEWPATFMEIHARHLQDLGRVPAEWVDALLADLAAAQVDPQSRVITPLVLEVVAERG